MKSQSSALRLWKKELKKKVHTNIQLDELFRISPSGRVVPEHSSFVFWKPPFLLDRSLYERSSQIMAGLFRVFMKQNRFPLPKSSLGPLASLIRYAFWQGKFLWIESLASLCNRNGYSFPKLFEIASLCALCTDQRETASIYYGKIPTPSTYFNVCWTSFFSRPAKMMDLQEETYALPEGSWMPSSVFNISSEGAHIPEIKVQWLNAVLEGNHSEENIILRKLMSTALISEENLLDYYYSLLARGFLFRANRMMLSYLKRTKDKPYLFAIVLNGYFQNQKYYAYLKHLIASEYWPGERTWYEVCFCMLQLRLESDQKAIWKRIFANKEFPSIPSQENQDLFWSSIASASQNRSFFPNLSFLYEDLVWNHFFFTYPTDACLLRRKYDLFRTIILEPINQAKDISICRFIDHSSPLVWTMYLYINSLGLLPLRNILMNLSGPLISIRILLGLCTFREAQGSNISELHHLSSVLLKHASKSHPLVQTIRAKLIMDEGEWEKAKRITSRLAKSYPASTVFQDNHSAVLAQITAKSS